jgi:hypothetical protein
VGSVDDGDDGDDENDETSEENTTKAEQMEPQHDNFECKSSQDVETRNETQSELLSAGGNHQNRSTCSINYVSQKEFGFALSSALMALTIEPNLETDTKEYKRAMKRSHALRELESTEESYVNDLDFLLNVSLFIHLYLFF